MSGLSDLPMPIRSKAMALPIDVTCEMMLRHRYDDVGVHEGIELESSGCVPTAAGLPRCSHFYALLPVKDNNPNDMTNTDKILTADSTKIHDPKES